MNEGTIHSYNIGRPVTLKDGTRGKIIDIKNHKYVVKIGNEEKEIFSFDVLKYEGNTIDKIDMELLILETKQIAENYTIEAAVRTAGWDKSSVVKFGKTIGVSPGKPGFFEACVDRMSGKFDKDRATRFCASLKDTYYGDTMWRGKGKEK